MLHEKTFEERIKEDHKQAEKLRLDLGMDSCGCADCQVFYRTINLEKYGSRVIRSGNDIVITAGMPVRKSSPKAAGSPSFEEIPPSMEGQALLSPAGDVTALTPALAIIDRFIIDALAANKQSGTRTIAASLKTKSINVSHMTVQRRIVDLKKRGVLSYV